MATTRFIDHLLEGDHASRPAAGDVPEGTLYSCTTHSLVYQSDTATWTTWATLGGSDDLDAIIAASAGQDIADALAGAAAPDAGNVFATMADVGGGGAPSTAEYVTTAADAGLSAERVIDLGAYSLLTRRAAGNTEDDQFDATSLDAKWLAYTGLDATYVLTDKRGWAHGTVAGYKLQAVPAGDWTIETEVISGDLGAAAYQDSGLILTNGTTMASATDARFGIGQRSSLQQYRVVFEKFVNGAFSVAYSEWAIGDFLDYYFLRINKSSTTYTVEISSTGFTWHRFFQTGSLGFTPTHFGIGGSQYSFYNYFLRY